MMYSSEMGGATSPAVGLALLLELGNLIVSSRNAKASGPHHARRNTTQHKPSARPPDPGPSGAWNDAQLHQRILAAKLLNRSSQERPSTSAGTAHIPITDLQAKVAALSRENSGIIQASAVSSAVARAKRALFIDKRLRGHVEGLWNEHKPLSIDVLLGPDCQECFVRFSDNQDTDTGQGDVTRDGLLLLERWTLSIYHKKTQESPQPITSQWLLNAVRSQLHFSQISAWNAKISEESRLERVSPDADEEPEKARQRKLSRETCNYKKLESNYDEIFETVETSARTLNIVYSVKKRAEFVRQPVEHVFPVTDIGGSFLKVVLESLPRVEEVPTVRCACASSSAAAATMKRRRSKECIAEMLTKPDGEERRGDAVFQMNYLLLDDRMQTPCSESGKHRCACDELELEHKRDSPSPPSPLSPASPTPTSIPILQAARFGFRQQSLLALQKRKAAAAPASTAKASASVGTQTDPLRCECACAFARSLHLSQSARLLDAIQRTAQANCDNNVNNDNRSCDTSFNALVKRPKLKKPTRIDELIEDRNRLRSEEATPLKTASSSEDYVICEKGDYGTFSYDPMEDFDVAHSSNSPEVPSSSDMVRFRYRLDSAASMVFHANTGLPLTSSPAPLKRGNNCFDYDSTINSVSSIRSALFHLNPEPDPCWSPGSSPGSPASSVMPSTPWQPLDRPSTPPLRLAADNSSAKGAYPSKIHLGPRSGLLGTFEESALKGRLEPAATVAGFTAELGASGAFCPPHKRLPVTVFFYSLGGNAAPYLGHINLGRRGYNVPTSGTIQVTLFNPHGTVVKMFVVPYDLVDMPAGCRTFLRQRTLYLPAGTEAPTPTQSHKWLRYLIHLRFLTSKSGKLYLHTDIRIIVSRKADLDTAAAHSPMRPIVKDSKKHSEENLSFNRRMSRSEGCVNLSAILKQKDPTSEERAREADSLVVDNKEISYELRSFTYTPDNPKFSPR